MNENRRLGAEVLARRIIEAVADTPLAPLRAHDYEADAMGAFGEALGRGVGVALFVGARAEGYNPLSILTGIGQGLGEYLAASEGAAAELRSVKLEVMIEYLEQGVAAGLGVPFTERPHCPKCLLQRRGG